MYESVVFAGGGSRCFWQLGFYLELEAVGLRPRQIAAVSAGSAMACLVVSGRWREGMDLFVERTRNNPGNVHWNKLLSRQRMFPHYEMYRGTILDVIDDDSFARICAGPAIHVLIATPPRGLPTALSATIGLSAYVLERRLTGAVHPRTPRRLGFRPQVVAARDCPSRVALADLVLQSSCTPPLTPFLRRYQAPVLDGGLVDPAPLGVLPEPRGRTLVLLTRPHRPAELPRIPDVEYAQPSQPIGISKWDYANPDGLIAAFELGRRDAQRHSRTAARATAA